jgi:hypothetical protein
MTREEKVQSREHQLARRELDALVADTVRQLTAPVDNPLIAIEQLRGKVLRFPPRGVRKQRAAIQDWCDELHFALCKQPEADRWHSELVAYERAEYQREQEARRTSCGDSPQQA